MLTITKNSMAALVLILIFIPASFAQTATKSDDDFVTEKGFKSKVFELKYRDPGSLGQVLRQLGSGFKGASLSTSSEFKTLTVRDFPENIATIEEAIKRLDTPAAPRPNIELHMYALIAFNATGAGDTTAQVPAELKDVITQLRGTLNYRNYELAATVVQRLTETPRGLQGKGTGEISGVGSGAVSMPMPYVYTMSAVSLVQNTTGAPTVQINEFSFMGSTGQDSAHVQTALNLRDGEKVVVGTATLRNRALVIVLTAKLVN